MSDDDKLGANSRMLRIGFRLYVVVFGIISGLMAMMVFSNDPMGRIFGAVGWVCVALVLYSAWRGPQPNNSIPAWAWIGALVVIALVVFFFPDFYCSAWPEECAP